MGLYLVLVGCKLRSLHCLLSHSEVESALPVEARYLMVSMEFIWETTGKWFLSVPRPPSLLSWRIAVGCCLACARSLTSCSPHTCWVIFPQSIFRHGPPAHGGLPAIAVRGQAKPLWAFTSPLSPNLAWLSSVLARHVRLHSSLAAPSLLLARLCCRVCGCVHVLCLFRRSSRPFPLPARTPGACLWAPPPSTPASGLSRKRLSSS